MITRWIERLNAATCFEHLRKLIFKKNGSLKTESAGHLISYANERISHPPRTRNYLHENLGMLLGIYIYISRISQNIYTCRITRSILLQQRSR